MDVGAQGPVAEPKVCVIFNPKAGRRRPDELRRRVRQECGPDAELRPTEGPGHAEELARAAAAAGFDVVAAAGGDGTVHEVANGLLRAPRADVAFQVVPIGSANDYHHSLAWENGAGLRWVDVGLARREDGKERFFVNGLGLGFNGQVTREARKIRHLRGIPLYGLALLRTLCYHYHAPPLDLAFDGISRREPTLALTINLGRREGNFIMAPDARLDDGWFDYLQAGALSRLELLRCIPGMISGHLPTNHPRIWRGRCKEVKVSAEAPLTVHLDGEFFCQAEDGIRRIEVRLLPAALAVRTGK